MLIKSMIFTLASCALTYVLCQAAQPKIYHVDLQKILREEAKVLAEQNLSPSDLETALLKAKKQVQTTIDKVGREAGAVLLTTPAFGLMTDATGKVTSLLSVSRRER
jgi:hypothetical protein